MVYKLIIEDKLLWQPCAGAVVLTDIVFWCLIVPFLSDAHLGLNTVRQILVGHQPAPKKMRELQILFVITNSQLCNSLSSHLLQKFIHIFTVGIDEIFIDFFLAVDWVHENC